MKNWFKRTNLLWLALIVSTYVLLNVLISTGIINNVYQTVLLTIGINIILAISLNLIIGITGQFSLGHAGFMIIGAYSCGVVLKLVAVTGIRNDWQVKTLYLFVSFFMVYAISDQLDIWPYFEFSLSAARQIAAVTAVAFALYLIFLDPKTKILFRKKLTEPVPGELRIR